MRVTSWGSGKRGLSKTQRQNGQISNTGDEQVYYNRPFCRCNAECVLITSVEPRGARVELLITKINSDWFEIAVKRAAEMQSGANIKLFMWPVFQVRIA